MEKVLIHFFFAVKSLRSGETIVKEIDKRFCYMLKKTLKTLFNIVEAPFVELNVCVV